MRSGPWKRREQEVTFHRNGTMSSSDGDKGEWWFDVGGLYWVCVLYAHAYVDTSPALLAAAITHEQRAEVPLAVQTPHLARASARQ